MLDSYFSRSRSPNFSLGQGRLHKPRPKFFNFSHSQTWCHSIEINTCIIIVSCIGFNHALFLSFFFLISFLHLLSQKNKNPPTFWGAPIFLNCISSERRIPHSHIGLARMAFWCKFLKILLFKVFTKIFSFLSLTSSMPFDRYECESSDSGLHLIQLLLFLEISYFSVTTCFPYHSDPSNKLTEFVDFSFFETMCQMKEEEITRSMIQLSVMSCGYILILSSSKLWQKFSLGQDPSNQDQKFLNLWFPQILYELKEEDITWSRIWLEWVTDVSFSG